MPLMLMEDFFFKILSQSSGVVSKDIIDWVASEFSNLLAASHEASASSARKRSLKSKANEASWTPLSHKRFSGMMKTEEQGPFLDRVSREFYSLVSPNHYSTALAIPAGYLSIDLDAFVWQGSSKVTIAIFTFLPEYEICKKGISATLVRTSDTARSPSIARDFTQSTLYRRTLR
ncbi:MAG: hypothetical protein Q9163_001123 [Psora crenata]